MTGINLFLNLINQYGYIGIFLVSFISNGTFIIPIPYLIVVYSLGASHILNPILIAIASGLGATLGELILYFLSMMGRVILPEKYKNRIDIMKNILGKYGPLIIFIFAATPLPDDVIYPVLGIMRYNFIKLFLSCFIGKTILSGVVVYAGFYSESFISQFLGGESMIPSIIAIVLGIIIAILILKVDWTKYLNIEYIKGEEV